ncbi:MAG: EcsC family protein [Solirubrobacteraceae bacterium]|nr:EcsC family protein [Solirubrobacteraceae bacterium]
MDDYDKKAWDALERERQRQLSRSPRRLVPGPVRERAGKLGRSAHDGASSVPGFDQAEDLVQEVLKAAGEVGARLAANSLWQKRIISAYSDDGHRVALITDIQQLALRDIDKAKPSIGIGYMAAGAATGAAAGVAVTSGEIAALVGGTAGGAAGGAGGGGIGAAPGAGAGAAPGAAVVVGAIAADTAAVLFGSAREVFHIAAYYGYDVNRPEERLRALGVLNYATASTQAAKNRAYNELQKLAGLIVRNAVWKQLDHSVITKIVRRVFELLGQRLTKRALGMALPFIGIAIGATLNAWTLSRTADGADLLYRQQFLCDKYELPFPDGVSATTAAEPEHDEDIPLTDIIEEEIEEQARADEPPDDEDGTEDPPAASI